MPNEQLEAKEKCPSEDDLQVICVQVSKRKYALAQVPLIGAMSKYHYRLITKPMSAVAAWQAREYYFTSSCAEFKEYLDSVGSGELDLES